MPPFRIYRDFLRQDLCADLLDWVCHNEPRFAPTLVFDGKYSSARRKSLGTREFGPMMTILREQVSALVPELQVALGLDHFRPWAVDLELVANHDGAFFKRHIDTRIGDNNPGARDRRISVVYYFHSMPKKFSGGELRLFRFGAGDDGEGFDIEPEHNSLVAFPSWVGHEVVPVVCPSQRFMDSRFAVNCWVRHERLSDAS